MLIYLVVKYEFSFDRFHTNAEQVYRVDNALHLSSGIYKYPNGPSGFGPTLLREVPEVVAFTRLSASGQQSIIEIDGEISKVEKLFFADSSFFEFFDFKLEYGDKSKVLDEPNTAVLTENEAMRLFGKKNAVGEILVLKGNQDVRYKVSGITASVPTNSHLKFSTLLSLETNRSANNNLDSWNNGGLFTYIRLNRPESAPIVEQKLLELKSKYVDENNSIRVNPSLVALTDIHLKSNLRNELEPGGSIDTIYVFSAIAVFILLIAAINYMNLATARSAKRAKEVGVRKVLGAFKKQLIVQFMGESLVLTTIATLLSFGIVAAIMPVMATFTGKALTVEMLLNGQVLGMLLLVIVFIGFGSGIYPAMFLSAFKPVIVLKGKLNPGMSGSGMLRKMLVIFQFVISIILMIGTYTVYRQLNYLKNKPLGFQRDHMMVISNTSNAITPQLNAFKNEMLNNPDVISVSASFSKPGGLRPIIFIKSETVVDDQENLNLAGINIDFDYMETFGIKILKGRDFDRTIPSDSTQSIIINQRAAIELNMEEDPVGQVIQINSGNQWRDMRIIGLVEDVNFEPLQRQTESTFYAPFFGSYLYLYVKVNPENKAKAIAHAEKLWSQFVPEQPFEYSFLKDDLDNLYTSEEQLSKVVIFFALLTIVIACLGLFGLSSFATEQRIKEIGVRKVLGASVSQVLLLLSKDFVLLIMLAFIIAAPVSYYLAEWWLQNFAFKVSISLLSFVLAGITALVIALFTISYKAIKAARANPVRALRAE